MITYYVKQIPSPKDKSPLFRAQAKSSGFVDFEKLSKNISDLCTVTRHDVTAVLDALQSHILANLQDGRSVRLPSLGSFHLRTKCGGNGVATRDLAGTQQVKELHVNFTKSRRLRTSFNLKNAQLKFRQIDGPEG